MNYSKDMLLESQSGFMMPFASADDEEIQITLGYGEQRHPVTGETFNHRGVDFVCQDKPLFALATGVVVGVGTDAIHENYIITKYGKYEVKYGHVSEAYVGYGKGVLAGQQIAQSGTFLHFEVSFAGQPLDPMEFLGMIYGNILQLQAAGLKSGNIFANMGVSVKTDYDKDQEEIEQMMQRWLGSYMQDIMLGNYTPPKRMESSLRNIFAQSADKNYFYEAMPTIGNPLGLSKRGAPLAARFQNILIGDFLNYMALRHNIFLSSWDESQKKNFQTRQQPTATS